MDYSSATSIDFTLSGLGANVYWGSLAVDNLVNKYNDVLVKGTFTAGTVSNDATVLIYAYGLSEGTRYSAGVPGTDAEITWGTTGTTTVQGFRNLPVIQRIIADATDDNNEFNWGPVGLAQYFGGVMPEKWGLVIHNTLSHAFFAQASSTEYVGVTY